VKGGFLVLVLVLVLVRMRMLVRVLVLVMLVPYRFLRMRHSCRQEVYTPFDCWVN